LQMQQGFFMGRQNSTQMFLMNSQTVNQAAQAERSQVPTMQPRDHQMTLAAQTTECG
jgi:hypothetical protein